MARRLLVFDFDGTIADTISPLIRIINKLADEFSYRKIRQKDMQYIRGIRVRDTLTYLNIPIIKLPLIIRRIREEMSKEMHHLKPAVNITPVLLSLKESGCDLGILTTNSRRNVLAFLKSNDLEVFDFVRSTHHLLSKHILLRGIKRYYVRRYKDEFKGMYYIGDEVRDIEAGRKAKVNTIGVTWGFSSKEALLREYPDYVVDKPDELVGIFSLIAYIGKK